MNLKGTLIYGTGMLGIIVGILFVYKFAFAVLDDKPQLIEPEPGVHCVVVSHGFMASVDCWKSHE